MALCLSLVLCFLLTMTQGVSGQEWNVSMTYKDICALTGSSVIMPCSFTHPPHLRVTKVYWGINPIKGTPLDDLLDNPQYAGRVQYSTDVKKNCTLTVSDVRGTDTAEYYARIETNKEAQRWQSVPVLLKVEDPPKGTSAVLYHNTDQTEGTSIILVCSSDANPPVEKYIWYRKTAGETSAIDSGQTIKFTLTSTRVGLYYCEATNRIGFQCSPFLEVSLAGFRRQTAALLVGLALVVSVTTLLGLGLLCWRKSRIANNDSGNTNNNAQNYENNHHQEENLYSIQMSSVYRSLNPDTIDTDAVYHTIQVR